MICMFKVIHYCLQMFFENFRNMCIKVYELDPAQLFLEYLDAHNLYG